jgi:uncharacterized protein (DUF849 family)
MPRKVIISCAVTGSSDTVKKNPAVPVTPTQIAKSSIDAAKAGAAVVHVHVRDPQTGKQSVDLELYRETVSRIRDSGVDVLINLTTGPGARFKPGDDDPLKASPGTFFINPRVRAEHVAKLEPDICSLDVATMNSGGVRDDSVMLNSIGHLRIMAEMARSAGVKPELEVFDTGHIRLAKHLIALDLIDPPPLFQLCLGVEWGAEATPAALANMASLLPAEANWAAFGISRQHFRIAAMTVLLGGHIRVGLEDCLYLEEGKLAPSNASLVERAVQIVHAIGDEVATPAEARTILGLRRKTSAKAGVAV